MAERAVEPAPSGQIATIVANLGRVVHAPDETLRLIVLCLVAEGHAIIEDFPGVGKTMLAKTLARSLDCRFARLQFTPDLLPSDVTGVNVFNQQRNEFEFRPGPVFANLLLVDEVNRASPKTQAALLECMEERQVSVDGITYPLEPPYMVLATQNPIEYEGTYPLPEAQLDRFTMRLSLGYPPLAEEARMLDEQTSWGAASAGGKAGGARRVEPGALSAGGPPLESLPAVADAADVLRLVEAARSMYVEESLGRYVVALLRQTRSDSRLYLGASPRAGIALLRVAKARALAEGRDYVVPDDVKAVAVPVLAHRLILAPEARSAALGPEELVADALAHTPVPV
jgi:MoxR-like ATPase